MKPVIVVLCVVLLQGCTGSLYKGDLRLADPFETSLGAAPNTTPLVIDESTFKMGASREEIALLFDGWRSKTIEKSFVPGGENGNTIEIIAYRKFFSGTVYEFTFVNNKLMKWRQYRKDTSPSPERGENKENKGMSDMCKWAIARGDQGGIMTFCD